MKLVGFSLWRTAEGEVYVTFPSRAFGAGTERRFFDYLRSAESAPGEVRRVKDWILDEYRQKPRCLRLRCPPDRRRNRFRAAVSDLLHRV